MMTQDPYDSYPADTPAKKRSPWIIVAIVLAVLLLCCCVVLVVGWFEGDRLIQLLRDMGYNIELCLPLAV
jgi:hypothetical protein